MSSCIWSQAYDANYMLVWEVAVWISFCSNFEHQYLNNNNQIETPSKNEPVRRSQSIPIGADHIESELIQRNKYLCSCGNYAFGLRHVGSGLQWLDSLLLLIERQFEHLEYWPTGNTVSSRYTNGRWHADQSIFTVCSVMTTEPPPQTINSLCFVI